MRQTYDTTCTYKCVVHPSYHVWNFLPFLSLKSSLSSLLMCFAFASSSCSIFPNCAATMCSVLSVQMYIAILWIITRIIQDFILNHWILKSTKKTQFTTKIFVLFIFTDKQTQVVPAFVWIPNTKVHCFLSQIPTKCQQQIAYHCICMLGWHITSWKPHLKQYTYHSSH